jgi:phosphocarrier protein
VLPALIGVAIVGVALGHPLLATVLFLLVYNGIRLVTSAWALRTASPPASELGRRSARRGCRPQQTALVCSRGRIGMALAVAGVAAGTDAASRGSACARGNALRTAGRLAVWIPVTAVRFALLTLSLAAIWAWRVGDDSRCDRGQSTGIACPPAAALVKLASTFQSHIEVARDDVSVNGKSIMGVMMLAAECGSVLTFKADGPDEEKAVEALAALVATGFGEQ